MSLVGNLKTDGQKQRTKSELVTERTRYDCIAAVRRLDLRFGSACASQSRTLVTAAAKASKTHTQSAKESQCIALFRHLQRKTSHAGSILWCQFCLRSWPSIKTCIRSRYRKCSRRHQRSALPQHEIKASCSKCGSGLNFYSRSCDWLSKYTAHNLRQVVYSRAISGSVLYIIGCILQHFHTELRHRKRLLIDHYMLSRSYKLSELAPVVWTPSAQSPADATTNKMF